MEDSTTKSGEAWVELVFTVSREHADSLSDTLMEKGALSVQVEDADAHTDAEQAVFGEPGEPPAELGWQRSKMTILSDNRETARQQLENACEALELPIPAALSWNSVAEQDWVELTQSQFDPIPVGDRLWICPSWHLDKVVESERIRIVLDPGLAFGTGSHPTTHMCLSWLDQHSLDGQSVIDYGCGSGILAIAAAKLGAHSVIGIDIDDQALRSAQLNAQNNDVELTLCSTREPAPEPVDLVLANILASPLKVLAPLLEDLLKPGATLVLAGLLDTQIDEVSAAYPNTDLKAWRNQQGWSCLAGQRR